VAGLRLILGNTSRPYVQERAPARETPWPADKVERWAIDRLIPYANNARTHTDAQIAQIAASMKEWGWTNPVLADEAGGIIAGHGRILAAKQLGLAEAPVMIARGWSEAQKRAYVIADNQLALNAGWNQELLRLELGELKLGGLDLLASLRHLIASRRFRWSGRSWRWRRSPPQPVLKNRTLIAIAQGVFELAIEQPRCVSQICESGAAR
jgi:hypothetical protein